MFSLSKQSKLLYLQNRDILTLIFHFPQTNKKKNIVEDIMKKTFLLFILALCSIALFAQNVNWLLAKKAGGTDLDWGNAIAVDANGNSYITGVFYGSATFGTTTLTSSGYGDIFVAKLGEVNSIDLPDIISFSGIRSIYPNPFNPLTTIDYEISMPADVIIEVYNNRGQLVRNFILGYKEQGSYKLTWEGKDNNGCLCSTGIYYIRMQAGKEIYIKKAVLLK